MHPFILVQYAYGNHIRVMKYFCFSFNFFFFVSIFSKLYNQRSYFSLVALERYTLNWKKKKEKEKNKTEINEMLHTCTCQSPMKPATQVTKYFNRKRPNRRKQTVSQNTQILIILYYIIEERTSSRLLRWPAVDLNILHNKRTKIFPTEESHEENWYCFQLCLSKYTILSINWYEILILANQFHSIESNGKYWCDSSVCRFIFFSFFLV